MKPYVVENIPDKGNSGSSLPIQTIKDGKSKIANPAETSKQQFEDLLTCHICFCHVSSPMMCPHCSKLFCESCIKRCLLIKSECPYCRKQVKGSTTMTSCNRFVNELITIVHDLIDHKIQQQICHEHEVPINYYCEDCSLPVCCECQMFGPHQGHSLKKLSVVYQARYDVLREMLTQFKSKLKQKQMGLKEVEEQLHELKKLKEKHLRELDEYIEQYRTKIIQETSAETIALQKSINDFTILIQNLNGLQDELNRMVEEAEKSSKYQLDEAFVRKVQEVTKEEVPILEKSTKTVLEEVIPAYFQSSFIVTGFSEKKKEKSTIFSGIQKSQGSEWRLKIYPNGNENVEGSYLSIFIEMVSTIHESTIYQYQIEIVNRKNPHHRMIREYQSTFEPGESWGYNKYIKLENLLREGFVEPETDELEIKYYIRNPFYYNVYKQKEAYIQHLDHELLKQETEIKELEGLLEKGVNCLTGQ